MITYTISLQYCGLLSLNLINPCILETILIYTPKYSPRFEYISKLVFCDILGVNQLITHNREEFMKSPCPVLNYSSQRFSNEPFLKASEFLFSESKTTTPLNSVISEGETGFFETSSDSLMPFDPFASSFLIVSRMEEYYPAKTDNHGRYEATSSVLYQFGLLEKPMVNIWAMMLAQKIKSFFPGLKFKRPAFRYLPTIDIDNAWAYLNKGFVRSFGASCREFLRRDFKQLNERFKVIAGKTPDPFDTYAYLLSHYSGHTENTLFFFHLGNQGKFDKPVSWKNHHFRDLIRDISVRFKTGVHPSWQYSETGNPEIQREEIGRYTKLTEKPAIRSRMHYLRLRFPETYRNLIAVGITEDYTMGFHDLPGFRAGISVPFRFYDLENEQETPLVVYPFQIMDVTLKQYMKLSPKGAMEKIDNLMNEVKRVGGIFSGIWHNESVSGKGYWEDYLPVFEFMNMKGFALNEG